MMEHQRRHPADTFRENRLEELLGTRGPGPRRAVRLEELDGLVSEIVFRVNASNPPTNFIIENRTTDPASPVTGQIWLRTDL